jgi:hypothetical protein
MFVMSDLERQRDTIENTEMAGEDGSLVKLGLRNYWRTTNMYSVDGLPGLATAYDAEPEFCVPKEDFAPDDERIIPRAVTADTEAATEKRQLTHQSDVKVVLAFIAGAVVATSYLKFLRGVVIH